MNFRGINRRAFLKWFALANISFLILDNKKTWGQKILAAPSNSRQNIEIPSGSNVLRVHSPKVISNNNFIPDNYLDSIRGDVLDDMVAEGIKASFSRNGIKRGNAVFICQNPSFDRIFFSQLIDADVQEKLLWPYHWLDLASMYWADCITKAKSGQSLLPWETGFSKDKIARALRLPPEEKPHRAMNGVDHLLLCYEAVVGFPGVTLR